MIFVCQIRNNLLGQVDEVETFDEGIILIKKIVQENGVELTPVVIQEIEEDYDYLDEGKEWSVCMGMTGD